MEVENFRIGNLVEEPRGYTHKIEILDLFSKRVRHGIPLTEEWLWRFGFANNINGFPEIDLDEKIGISITFKKTVDTHIVWFAEKDIIEYTEITTLKYVHQLQNLYFALTGKELEIK